MIAERLCGRRHSNRAIAGEEVKKQFEAYKFG
jgi:hypothetical protein